MKNSKKYDICWNIGNICGKLEYIYFNVDKRYIPKCIYLINYLIGIFSVIFNILFWIPTTLLAISILLELTWPYLTVLQVGYELACTHSNILREYATKYQNSRIAQNNYKIKLAERKHKKELYNKLKDIDNEHRANKLIKKFVEYSKKVIFFYELLTENFHNYHILLLAFPSVNWTN